MSNSLPLECDQNTLERLAFIKYLYNVAVEQSRMPEPMCWQSLLSFHDSIELFLDLVCWKMNVKSKDLKFMEYWAKLSDEKIDLKHKESCRKLNEGRNALKHSGTHPAKLDVEEYRITATNFFTENAQIVFGKFFSELSILYLMRDEKTKEILQEAESLIGSDNKSASEKIVRALNMSFEKVRKSHKWDHYNNPYEDFGFGIDKIIGKNYGSTESHLTQNAYYSFLDPLVKKVFVLSFGIDYIQFSKYYALSPIEELIYGDKQEPTFNYTHPRRKTNIGGNEPRNLTDEEVKFCFNFVVGSIIRIQDVLTVIEGLTY